MSSILLGSVWAANCGSTAKLLLAYIADSCDHVATCPAHAVKDLADMARVSDKTVRRALKELTGAGLLFHDNNEFCISIDARPAKPVNRPAPLDPKPPTPSQAEPAEATQLVIPREQRLADFCAAWGLTTPSNTLLSAWHVLEESEAKHNTKIKHRDDGGATWDVINESIADLMPAILHAVRVFQQRTEQGAPVHADGPPEFVKKQLWLAPDYQVSLTAEPEVLPSEDELDAMVMEMNRAGGAFSCHLRTSMIDEDTGERITETDRVYAKRVLAKYDEFKHKAAYFQE